MYVFEHCRKDIPMCSHGISTTNTSQCTVVQLCGLKSLGHDARAILVVVHSHEQLCRRSDTTADFGVLLS